MAESYRRAAVRAEATTTVACSPPLARSGRRAYTAFAGAAP